MTAAEAFEPESVRATSAYPQQFERLIQYLALGAIALAMLARFFARPHAPFWLDEAATGAIISAPTFPDFWREIYWEVSSPLYFILMRGWQAVAGLSNEALRLPSAIASALVPLGILLVPVPRLSRTDRYVWAALLALWVPGIGFGQDARCYAFVLLFATLQTVALARLLFETNLKNACWWVGWCALSTASHYDAAILAIAQGLVFLGVRRLDAVKQWPSLLLTLPVVAMVAWQWPEMQRFMQPDTTWYQVHDDADVVTDILYILGSFWWLALLPISLVIAAVIGFRRKDLGPSFGPLIWVGVASLLGAAVLIQLGAVRPILIARYLAPFVPGIILLLVLMFRILGRGAKAPVLAAPLAGAIAIGVTWFAGGAWHPDSVIEPLSYQSSSEYLMQRKVRSVVFTWDNPNARAMHPEQIRSFGEFFFRRAGADVTVIPAKIAAGQDPNQVLHAAAAPEKSAIIWVYDRWVIGTAARTHRPAIEKLDPSYGCVTEFAGKIGIVTCIPGDGSHGASGER